MQGDAHCVKAPNKAPTKGWDETKGWVPIEQPIPAAMHAEYSRQDKTQGRPATKRQMKARTAFPAGAGMWPVALSILVARIAAVTIWQMVI